MTHQHRSEFLHLLRAFTGSLLVAGIVLTTSAAGDVVAAQATGPGSTVAAVETDAEATIRVPYLRPAAERMAASGAEARLALGMLLILGGCALHGLWILRGSTLRAHRRPSRRA